MPLDGAHCIHVPRALGKVFRDESISRMFGARGCLCSTHRADSLHRALAGSPDPALAGSRDRALAGSRDRALAGSLDPTLAGSLDPALAGSLDRALGWISLYKRRFHTQQRMYQLRIPDREHSHRGQRESSHTRTATRILWTLSVLWSERDLASALGSGDGGSTHRESPHRCYVTAHLSNKILASF